MSRGNQSLNRVQVDSTARGGRSTMPLLALHLARLLALATATFAFSALAASCGERYSLASNSESLIEGREGGISVAFNMNHRPVKLELYLRIDGGSAIVELDHPDGRTAESFEFKGPGIREFRKEFAKEPGNWGLRVTALGGGVSYWAALHDRKKYIGPEDEAKRLVERK